MNPRVFPVEPEDTQCFGTWEHSNELSLCKSNPTERAMTRITDADRAAAQELRVILADICGFWHQPGDNSPICLALARHRQAAEARTMNKLVPLFPAPASAAEADLSLRPAARPSRGAIKLSA